MWKSSHFSAADYHSSKTLNNLKFYKTQQFVLSINAIIRAGAYLGGGPLCHGPPLWVARIAKLHSKVSKIEAWPPLCKLGIRLSAGNLSEFGWKKGRTLSKDLFFWRPPDWAEKTFGFRISAEKSLWILAKTFFFFFGDHLILGGKKLWISELSETFRLKFRTNRLKLIQDQWKFESRSFAHFSLFQNSPPLFKILRTLLHQGYNILFK